MEETASKSNIAMYLLDQLRMHGLSFLLLGIAVWYFHAENLKMKGEIKQCNDALIEMYRTDRSELLEVVRNNTAALRIKTQDEQ